MIQIDWQSRIPIYEQLVRGVVRLRSLGVLSSGEQLPSIRSLASSLGVNPNTVQKAYQMLETQQIIYSVSGKGSFVSPANGASEQLLKATEQRVRGVLSEAALTGLPKKTATRIVDEIYEERSAHND